ncbi:MAG: hypothetical protein ACPGRG_13595 [Marinomonas sp.]|nr:hypothetical protein [Marinomonas pontica]MCW8355020.1 hypothetical protein [Marinomonas pontica]
MTALIVIFITLSLMGSALWIVPPKKERQKMSLRMHARKLGITVQLTSIDLPDKWDKSKNRQKTVAYSYYRPKQLITLPDCIWILPYEVWKYQSISKGWWCSEPILIEERMGHILSKHGSLLTGIKIAPESVSLYWNEAGDESTLNELSELIYALEKVNSSLN